MKNMKILKLIMLLLVFSPAFSQEKIKMKYEEGGVYTIPCKVNGLALRFVFDTGTSAVSISAVEALFMLRNGYLSDSDVGGSSAAMLADGSIVDFTEIILRRLEIGGKVLTNVKASVINSLEAPLLLGQSALQKLGGYSIDGDYLIIGNSTNNTNNTNNTNSNQKKYYYNAQWKGVANNNLATYYRIVDYNTKKYKDYYVSGKLRGEGGFTSIDSNDDTNTVFDGEQRIYYESGKLSAKSYIKNGKREGERFLYPETGDFYKIMTYKDGERTYIDYEVDLVKGTKKRINIP